MREQGGRLSANCGDQSVFGRSVARDAAGNFVVVWDANAAADPEVFAQRSMPTARRGKENEDKERDED